MAGRGGSGYQWSLACGAAGFLIWPATGYSQTPPVATATPEAGEGLSDIVVTATKSGATALQKTPIAIAAFGGAELARAQVNDVRDLLRLTPNVAVPQNNVFAQIYIRGVGSNNVFNGSDPSSTVHVDGIYYSRPYSQFATFLDVDRVEVLRGPQGTLYGRNSVGGTINVISRRPTEDLSFRAEALYGNYDAVQAKAAVSGALAPGLVLASLSASYLRHDAYRRNVVASGNDINDQNEYAVRGQLLVTPASGIEATTRADLSRASFVPMGYAKILRPYDPITDSILGDYSKVALNRPSDGLVKASGVSEDILIRLSDTTQLKSLTAYRRNSSYTLTDTDSTDRDIALSLTSEKQHQFSQEFNLIGDLGRFSYVAGLYYFYERVSTFTQIDAFTTRTFTGIYPVSRTYSRAAFAQGRYDLDDRWSLTVGGRYLNERKEFDGNVGTYSRVTGLPTNVTTLYDGVGRYKAFTPKFGVQFQANRDLLWFASATRGFKSGGFNQTSRTASARFGFRPETLWSYETGIKSDWLDRRLRLNLTAFHYDYKDLQVQAFLSLGVTDISNAATAKIDGVELETTVLPVPNLRIQGALNYLNARYSSYPGASAPGGRVIDASGNRLNAAPRFSGNVVAQYDVPLADGANISLRGEYFRQSREYYVASNDPAQSQKAYGLINASVAYRFSGMPLELSVFGRNLADRQFVTATATIAPVVSGRPGDPRTYGIRAALRY